MSKIKPQFRIESDGTPQGTKVFLIESGEEVRYVSEIDWHLDMNGISRATISLFAVALSSKAVGQ